MPVVDASFLIDLERDAAWAVEAMRLLVERDEDLLLPMTAAMEQLTGVMEDDIVTMHMLEESFELVPFTKDHALEGARLARAALRQGRFPGWSDVQIATVAKLEATYVLTSNPRHFRALGVQAWDPRTEPMPS